MFVALGWDDNGFSGLPGSGGEGGLRWALELARTRRHADGAPLRMSFYLTSRFGTEGRGEEPAFVRQAWAELAAEGHELGNHGRSHEDGGQFDDAAWEEEIAGCSRDLCSLGLVAPSAPLGFRAPYLRYNDATLRVLSRLGFAYDCSIEAGFQPEHDGTNFVWPHRLERFGGLWELPAYVVIAPPDDACERFGLAPGFRKRLAARQPYFSEADGKITGFDYNLWFEFGMTHEEFVATLCYTLELRLRGNRAPLLFGGHTDYYSSKYGASARASLAARRAAFSDFLDRALIRPEVRIVTAGDVLAFVEHG